MKTVVVDMDKDSKKFFRALLMKVLTSLTATFIVWLMKLILSVV